MARPLEHGITAAFQLPTEMHRALGLAAAAVGVNRSEFVRAAISQALRDEDAARAGIDAAAPLRPRFPVYSSR
jgi:predicted transcriptional regulator